MLAGTINYTYDARGRKLRKVDVLNGTTTSVDYIDGIQYSNGAIDFIQTEEGRVLNSGGNYHYEYSLTDHLGNARVSFDTYAGTAIPSQTDDYYPFGMEISRGVTSPKNEYLYNKKELQEEFGQYDYGARFYDPIIARWNTVDPMAEMGRRESPYGYAFDDPMRFTDPDGMWPDWSDIASTAHDVAVGAINAAFEDNTGVDARSSHSSSTAYNVGRIIGHVAALVQGGSEAEGGGTAAVAGVVAAPESGGLSLAVSAGGVAVAGHGVMVMKNAIVHMLSGDDKEKSHGNKLDDKPAERYTLRDKNTEEVVKHGETTRGEDANGAGNQKRYSKNQLKEMNADYQKENSGTKKDMHQEQHQEILNHKGNNNGQRPKYNKSDY